MKSKYTLLSGGLDTCILKKYKTYIKPTYLLILLSPSPYIAFTSPYLTITFSTMYHFLSHILPLPHLYLAVSFIVSYHYLLHILPFLCLTITFSVPCHYLLYILLVPPLYLTITPSKSYHYLLCTLPLTSPYLSITILLS